MKLLDDARLTLQYFTLTDWKFPANNFESLSSELIGDDKKIFYLELNDKEYADQLVELREAAIKSWSCLKRYLLKEDPADVDKARKRLKW